MPCTRHCTYGLLRFSFALKYKVQNTKTRVLYLLDECERRFRTSNHGLYLHLCTSSVFFLLFSCRCQRRQKWCAARFCKRCTKTALSSSISSILLTFFFFCFWKGSPNIYKPALLTEVDAKIRDQKKIWSWKYVCCINGRGHPLHDDYWQRIGPRIKTCHGRGEREVHIDDLTLMTYSVLPPPFQYITASIILLSYKSTKSDMRERREERDWSRRFTMRPPQAG